MASDRIPKDMAYAVNIPPFSWYEMTVRELLDHELDMNDRGRVTVEELLLENVPVNKPLKASLKEHGVKSQMFFDHNWYPIVGSQRLRALIEIPERHQDIMSVAHLDADYMNFWRLWPEHDFSHKARAITFQMWELAFKSRYFENEKDPSGVDMRYFEDEGERNKWKHRDGTTQGTREGAPESPHAPNRAERRRLEKEARRKK